MFKFKFLKKQNNFIAIIILFFIFLNLSGCSKNLDTYKNSVYFNVPESEMVPQIISSTETNFSQLALNVKPAIVAISCTFGTSSSIGAGFCVKSSGYILTNQHVIDDARTITIFLSDGEQASAIVLWQDEIMDIAILKANITIPYLPLADNKNTKVGEDVLAVGTPLSLDFTHSFTKGIVSALNRTIKISTDNGEALMQNLIQHDASINPGNSGGPLINSTGEVVGINTLKISTGEGLGFAIPINSVSSVINNVYNNYNYSTPYLGVYGYDANIAYFKNEYNGKDGLYLLNVAQNSPAYSAGLRESDVIISVNNIKVENALEFRNELFKKNVDDYIVIEYIRDNEKQRTSVKLTSHPTSKYSID